MKMIEIFKIYQMKYLKNIKMMLILYSLDFLAKDFLQQEKKWIMSINFDAKYIDRKIFLLFFVFPREK